MDRCGGLFPGMRIDPLCSRQLISCCRFSAGVQVGDWRPNNGQHQGKYQRFPTVTVPKVLTWPIWLEDSSLPLYTSATEEQP